MTGCLSALRALLSQLLLALVGQPVPGPSRAERARHGRKRRRLETEDAPPGALATLGTLAREAVLALLGQPPPRSSASRRRPRP